MPTTSTSVASAGRPFASPPRSANRSVPVRWISIAASRNIAAETRPWLTEWSTAPVMPRLFDGEDAEHDQAHLRHRRVRDHAAHVRLAEREQRAVDEARRGEHEHDRAPALDRPREVPQHDPDQPEDGGLGDDAREQRGDLGRSLGVGGAQPAVERQQRRLHRERDHEAEEDPLVAARARVDQVERPLGEAEDDDRREHQQRARHRVDDERDRRGDPVRARPRRRRARRSGSASPRRRRRRGAGPGRRRRRRRRRSGTASGRSRRARGRGRPRRRSRSRRRRRRRSARRARARSRRSRRCS